MFKDMICDLEQAEYYIFLEYFIIGEGVMWNRILEILERKVSEGVDVRLIYDDMGCASVCCPGNMTGSWNDGESSVWRLTGSGRSAPW